MNSKPVTLAALSAVIMLTKIATALISILRLLGNKDAELITTGGKGYRPDGSRNPHSWSIVDEHALLEWLLKFLLASDGRR